MASPPTEHRIFSTTGPTTRHAGALRDRPARHAQDMASVTTRRLTWGYVLGLSLLATITIASGWMIADLMRRQADHAAVINLAGAQRMLSQRIAALAMEEDRAWAMPEIAAAAQRMAVSQASLRERAADPLRGTPALRAHYLGGAAPLDAAVAEFLALATALPAHPELARPLRAMALVPLLPLLHEAVALHEAAAREKSHRILRLHEIATGAALLLILMEGIFIFRPMVRRVAAQAGRLRLEADTDPLTGLMNRRAVTQTLRAAMGRDEPVAVIAVDLDHFKEANDAEGHAAGDTLLRVAAERIRAAIRGSDIVGRVGGDEFVAFLPGVHAEEEALLAARRIRDALHEPVAHQGRLLRLGATIGVAMAPMDANQPEAILRAADEALMRAKRQGRGSVGRATAADAARVTRDATILRALKSPLGAAGEEALPGLTAHLQPIIGLHDGAVHSVEALARWHHPELGQVPPDEMFATAQRAGMAGRLSGQVRGHALAAYAGLRREGLAIGRLALNLSAAELLREGVVEGLERQCAAVGLDFDGITIEITEDALLDRVAHTTLSRLAALRGRGARLSLDDFGTGTSGLAQLLRLPLDEIKLDRAFTQKLGLDGRAERIVEGTIHLARSMGLRVVAEGIEDEAQARALRELGCDMGQGWLYARAMSGEDLREWMRARKPVLPLRLVSSGVRQGA